MAEAFEVLVLGGGIAGVAAALAAAQQGARVAVVRAAAGATSVSLGAWRGVPPQPLREALAHVGFEVHETASPVPRPDGTLLRADVAPLSHLRASAMLQDSPALVCGIDGIADFDARALAALWTDAAGLSGGALVAASIALDGTPAAGWSSTSLAALLEREPERLARPLAAVARELAAQRVILPAVLGIEQHPRVHAALEAETSLQIGEALGARPSLPGWRLDVALRDTLATAAIPLIAGRVTAHERERDRVTAVTVGGNGGQRTIRAASCVLATGKFLGGGIDADMTFVERALGCDVALHRFDRIFRDASESLLLTAELRTDAQPLLAIGVHCDADARPLAAAGDPIYRNVFVAGSVRAGVEAAALGLGDAAADGWSAGTRAVTFARGN